MNENNRYRVETREHHGGGLFELEITKYFEVIDNRTHEIIMTFTFEESAHYTGQWSDWNSYGVTKVEISEDGREVVVYDSGNAEPKRIPLPVSEG